MGSVVAGKTPPSRATEWRDDNAKDGDIRQSGA
jgi:hypothetical protein